MQGDIYFRFLVAGAMGWFVLYMLVFHKRINTKLDTTDWLGVAYYSLVILIFIGKWIFESFYLDKRNSLHVAVSGVVTGMGFCHLAVFVSFLILKKIDQFQNKEKVG